MKSINNTLIFLLLITISINCSGKRTCKSSVQKQNNDTCLINDSLKLKEVRLLFITGNFYNEDKIDTIETRYFSKDNNVKISHIPNSQFCEWEDMIDWFNKNNVELSLICSTDTLYLGAGYGLYCLLNLGDINSDGYDEIAFVVDKLDFSNLNSCEIYTICKSKWKFLKSFSINEYAFDNTNDILKSDCGIKDFLEQKNGKWFYRTYKDFVNDENVPMKLLHLEKCR